MECFKKYLSEAIGTCLLVFFGCGTACAAGTNGTGYLLTALSFGLALTALCFIFGGVSGCHVNPAVSLAMLLMRKIGALECVGYIASQMIGAIGGSALLSLIFNASALEDKTGNLGANLTTGLGGVWAAILIEVLLTFAFVLTVIGVTSRKESGASSGFAIGAALTLAHIFGIPFTGTSVNPARSLGPALMARGDALRQYWVFLVAPLIGAVLAALLSIFLQRNFENKKKAV